MKKDSDLLRDAFIKGSGKMTEYIENGISDDDKDHVRAILSVLGSFTRLKAVENNESMINLSVARSMANNTDELKGLLKKSLPEFVK